MSKRYEEELGENAGEIKLVKTELKKADGLQVTTDLFLETIRRYTRAQELTQHMLTDILTCTTPKKTGMGSRLNR